MILIKISKKNKTTIANAFTNHSSEKIQNQRLFDEHFIQYQSLLYKKSRNKSVDIKEEKANCKSLTKIKIQQIHK